MTWTALLAWLGLSSVFLADGPLLVANLGDRLPIGARQTYLAFPLLFGPVAFLLTPGAPWAAALIGAAFLLHLAGHGLWVSSLALAPAPAGVSELVRQVCAEWGAPGPDRVRIGPMGPAVIGLHRQTLVLPPAAFSLSPEDLRAVLAHELAHISHRDALRLWLAGTLRTLLFWHPLARLNLDALRLQVELQADARAAAWLGDGCRYALSLARLGLAFGSGGQTPAWGAALAERPAEMTVRLQTLLEPVPAAQTLRLPSWLARPKPGDRRNPPQMGQRLAHTIILSTFLGYLGLYFLVLWLL